MSPGKEPDPTGVDFKDVKNKTKFKLDFSNKNTFDPKFSEELSARLHDPNLLNKKKKNLVSNA
jgi:hypothetical protein